MRIKHMLMNKYPIYIISKGRWDTRLTSKTLEELNVPYHIVIEPQEYEQYASVIDPSKILVLPFSNLGQGSIPARNWVWEHSISIGADRHWIMDDNIRHFYRFNNNEKIRFKTGSFFRAMEDFTDRYTNVPMAGPQYMFFVIRREDTRPPIYINSRVYSCILLSNHIPHRWRGRYNEDTDLALRLLKDGYCTFLFNGFLQGKSATMSVKGGNTELLYKLDGVDGRLLMAQSLQEQHPDVVRVTRKWGRWQHHVNYAPFRANQPILRDDIEIPEGVNEYGMKKVKVDD